MHEIERPIFIIGTGRCGSTIFHQILSHHSQVAWLSRICDIKPDNPRGSWWAMQALDLPLIYGYVRKLVYPTEAYRFWNYLFPGFAEPCRDLLKEDVTPLVKKRIRDTMAQMLTLKRQRMLIKITGWPRIGFLKEVFPDAKFIHVYRDGRAVVNSLLGVDFWSGWKGPAKWRWGQLSPAQQEKWERYNWSFVALAAIEWEILMTAFAEAGERVPSEDLLEISYEDLCQEPVVSFQQAIQFGELEWTPDFEAIVQKFSLKNTNYKWQEHLNQQQQEILNSCLAGSLQNYGYA